MTKQMKFKVKRTVLYGFAFIASKWLIIFLLYNSGFWTYWFLFLFPIADFTAAIVAIRYLKGNFKQYFTLKIEEHYPENAKTLIKDIEARYKRISLNGKIAKGSRNPLDKRLKFSTYFLALIQELEKKGDSFDQIRKVCLEIASEYVKPKNKLHKWWKKYRPSMVNSKMAKTFFKLMNSKIQKKGFFLGFRAKVITDKEETLGFGYGIDIYECGICQIYKQHQADKYASILCEVDEMTSSLAGLELVRSGTIANGASKCDFRFKRIENQSIPA